MEKENKKDMKEESIFNAKWFLKIISISSFIIVLILLLGYFLREYTGSIIGGVSDTISNFIFVTYLIVFSLSFYFSIKLKNKKLLKNSVGAMLLRFFIAIIIIVSSILFISIFEYLF